MRREEMNRKGLFGAVLGAALVCGLSFSAMAAEKTEGDGFASPEAAAAAYVEAFKNEDMDQMLAAFAVETFAANFDFDEYVENTQMYAPTVDFIPNTGAVSERLNAEAQRGVITKEARYQYLTLSGWKGADYAQNAAMLSDFGSGAQLREGIFGSDEQSVFADMELLGFVDMAALNDSYAGMAENMKAALPKNFGADEAQPLAAYIKSNGKNWIMCLDAGKYGDSWYLIKAHGSLEYAMNTSVNYLTGGIVAEDTLTQAGMDVASAVTAYQE